MAIVLLVLAPVVHELRLPALATLALPSAALTGLIAWETISYGEARARIRRGLRHDG